MPTTGIPANAVEFLKDEKRMESHTTVIQMLGNRGVIRVSRKRQITIPLKFYEALNLGDQVECPLEGGAIVIRPLRRTDDEFSVEILKDLLSKGFSGDELVREFEAERYRVKKAVDRLREEADRIADGVQPASCFDDVFGPGD